MNDSNSVRLPSIRWMFVLVFMVLPQFAHAQWQAKFGGQSKSMAHQALAFLPNELWIHAGDSVTWTSNADEIHTVTFLTVGQVRLPFQVEHANNAAFLHVSPPKPDSLFQVLVKPAHRLLRNVVLIGRLTDSVSFV